MPQSTWCIPPLKKSGIVHASQRCPRLALAQAVLHVCTVCVCADSLATTVDQWIRDSSSNSTRVRRGEGWPSTYMQNPTIYTLPPTP